MPHWKPAQTSPSPKDTAPPSSKGPAKELTSWPSLDDLPPTCDPYLTWAVASRWRGEARSKQTQSLDFMAPKGREIRVLLRAKSPAALLKLKGVAGIRVDPTYFDDVPGASAGTKARFATATVRSSALSTLIGYHGEIQFELAAAVRDQGGSLKGDAKGYFGQQTDLDIEVAKNRVQSWLGDPTKPAAKAAVPAARGTIAVFDYGCPFLRKEFMQQDEESTRITAIWHQESFKVEAPWTESRPKELGRVLAAAEINRLIELSRDKNESVDEAGIYSGLNYLIEYAHPRRRVFTSTHGAHVLDMAAGRQDPLNPDCQADAASEANLIFVQMPEDTAGDSSAASLGASLLDALRFALEHSRTDAPLVFNVSFGTSAGPHDGSSLIEQAMDELLEKRPTNFAIVLAAGNSRRLGLHCRRTVSDEHTALFRINIVPGDRTDTFVEFWYQKPPATSLEFRARLPSGNWSAWTRSNSSTDLMDDTETEVVASIIHRRKVPNGKRSMVLLALRPTETPTDDDGPLSPPGPWEVEVRLASRKKDPTHPVAVQVEAWIKRDDSRPFSGRVQSTFWGLDRTDSDNTLNGLATGDHTLVTSGFRWSSGEVVDYASRGPRRAGEQLPLAYGLCERDSVHPGIYASAVRSGEKLLMNGTSVAAPVVARQVYNLMHAVHPKTLTKLDLWTELRNLAERPGSCVRID